MERPKPGHGHRRVAPQGTAGWSNCFTGHHGFWGKLAGAYGWYSHPSSDLPVVIMVIDRPERISGILPRLEQMVQEGLIIRQEVQVIKYTASFALKQHPPPPVTKTTRNTYMLPKPLFYFDLLDAFQKPGCPIRHQIVERSRHGLGSLFYEQVTGVGTRQRLRASQGFWAWHAWMAT